MVPDGNTVLTSIAWVLLFLSVGAVIPGALVGVTMLVFNLGSKTLGGRKVAMGALGGFLGSIVGIVLAIGFAFVTSGFMGWISLVTIYATCVVVGALSKCQDGKSRRLASSRG